MAGIRKIKPDIESRMVHEYGSGIRASVIGKKYGYNRKTVTEVVRRNGGFVRDQRSASGRPVVDPQSYVEQTIELRSQGLSQAEIGKRIGVCQATISKVLRQAGLPTSAVLSGEKHGAWKGGVVTRPDGYVAEKLKSNDDFFVMATRSGYVLRHRLAMARHLGRALNKNETVHHINGNRSDNRIENLQLRQGKHGKGVVMCCAACGSINIISKDIS